MSYRLAVISDLHADVHALTDALAEIESIGCDAIVCCGDVIDYGIAPEETIALLRERRIPTVRGNHDRLAIRVEGDRARDVSGWDLSDESVTFLAGLPTTWRATIEGVRVVVTHARPGNDMAGIYPDRLTVDEGRKLLDDAGADVLIVGHTHIARRFDVPGRGVICNPGALLRDPAEPLEAAWVLDPASGKFVKEALAVGGTFGVLALPEGDFIAGELGTTISLK